MLVVLGIIGIVAAIAMPATTQTLADLRLRGDARSVHNMVGLAKMRAASRFSRSRVYVDLTTNSFHLEHWDKGASTWVTEGGSTTLSDGVEFGFGDVASPPPSTQTALGQSPLCKTDDGEDIAGTSCIVFNSRGIPVNDTGNPTGNSAFYLTDNVVATYAVTLSATPLIRLWWTPADTTKWVHR
jgi:Tfp pilus assembly protein FimT